MSGETPRDRLGDEIEVLRRVERHVDAGEASERAGPLAAAIDERFARDRPFVLRGSPADAGNAALGPVDAFDLDAFDDRRAVHARAFGQRLREIGRIRLAVAGNPHRAGEVVGAQDRNAPPGLGRRDELELDAEALRAGHLALHRHEALGRSGDIQAAALLPAGREPRLFLERRVEVDAVAAHPRRVARRARLPDETRGVPRRAARELALLEQHDVLHAELREVIGGRDARRCRLRRSRREPGWAAWNMSQFQCRDADDDARRARETRPAEAFLQPDARR